MPVLCRGEKGIQAFLHCLKTLRIYAPNLCVFALSVKQRLESETPICFAVRSRKVFRNILHFFILLNKYLK